MLLAHILEQCRREGFAIRQQHGEQEYVKIDYEYGEITPLGIQIVGRRKDGSQTRRVYGLVQVFSDQNIKRLLSDKNIVEMLGK